MQSNIKSINIWNINTLLSPLQFVGIILLVMFLWNANAVAQVSLTIKSGNTLSVSGNMKIYISGNWTNNGTFIPGNGSVMFNGTNNQTIINPSGETYNNLTVNKSGGNLTLNDNVTVNDTLTLTSGNINTTSSDILTLTSNANVSGDSSGSFVNGPMRHTVASTSKTEKRFPIGKGSAYRPVELTVKHNNSTSTQYTAEVFNSTPSERNLPDGIDRVSSVRYWEITKSVGADVDSAWVTIYYGNDDGVNDPDSLRAVKDDGSGNWVNIGGAGSGVGNGYITSSVNFTDFNGFTFTLGNATGGDNPLPVELSVFIAQFLNNRPTLYWTTATETDNLGWNIYRGESENAYQTGQAFKINPDMIEGAGTSSQPTEYSFQDEHSVIANTTYWYWLESIDYSGLTDIYGPVSLTIPEEYNDDTPEIPKWYGLKQNYPNPFNPNTVIYFKLRQDSEVCLEIYNVKGELVKELYCGSVKADEVKSVSWNGKDESGKEVGSGIYLYKLRTNDREYSKRMLLLR